MWLWGTETEMMRDQMLAWTSSEPAKHLQNQSNQEMGLSKHLNWGNMVVTESQISYCPLGKIHQIAVPDQLGIKGCHDPHHRNHNQISANWKLQLRDWMGHEDRSPCSPQGSQISTKITCIKKRITVLSNFLHILKSVIQSHHIPIQEHQYYAFAVWWKTPVWSFIEADAVQSNDFVQNKLTTHTYSNCTVH